MTKQIILKSRPVGMPTLANFELQNTDLPELQKGEVYLEAKIISVDPYMRGRMSDAKSYAAPYVVGGPIYGGIVARVKESKAEGFSKDEYVLGFLPWKQEMIVQASGLQKIDATLGPLGYYLGILGMPGLTAYFGLLDIGKPKKGETVVVSGAAGAVGMIVGQLAKIHGCQVIGIAGDEAKVTYLRDTLKFDRVINYKTTGNMSEAIVSACPNGVDVYFDNVGGTISDAVIENLNGGARIVVCGQISLYNAKETPVGPRIQSIILKRSVLMQGFIVSNYSARFPKGFQALAGWVKSGDLQYNQTVMKGFEKLPEVFLSLFEGKNLGKLLVEV
jgi:NADPH:quinone reductase